MKTEMINQQNWEMLRSNFLSATPFNHVVIDNFWTDEVAEQLYSEFPGIESNVWNGNYLNPIENKKSSNMWDKFPAMTYNAFMYLNSPEFTYNVRYLSDRTDLIMDVGLHGGGLHCHGEGGNLNLHLDYNVHPKLGMQRKLNLIIYLSKDWDQSFGGGLELWTHNSETNRPAEHAKTLDIKFNRAVLFDTTQNSWHGLPYPLKCPPGQTRKSMAIYYLGNAPANTEDRPKALFAPREDQKGNVEIERFIAERSQVTFKHKI